MTWAVPDWWTTALLALAVWRLYRLIGYDTIFDAPRDRLAPEGSKRRELVECPFCSGFHLSVAAWLLWLAWPRWSLIVAVPFAISALVALMEINLGPDD